MWSDLEIKGLVIPIEAMGRQEKIRQVNLCIEITMDEGVNLQNDEIIHKSFKE